MPAAHAGQPGREAHALSCEANSDPAPLGASFMTPTQLSAKPALNLGGGMDVVTVVDVGAVVAVVVAVVAVVAVVVVGLW